MTKIFDRVFAKDSAVGTEDRSAAYTNAASSYCFEIIYNKNLRAGYWRFIWCFCMEDRSYAHSCIMDNQGVRWREIRRFVLEFKALYFFLNSHI